MKITIADLKKWGACLERIEWFTSAFPSGEAEWNDFVAAAPETEWVAWVAYRMEDAVYLSLANQGVAGWPQIRAHYQKVGGMDIAEKNDSGDANCKHEAIMLWMNKAAHLRGYLLTFCLDCNKTINAEVTMTALNPFNQRVQNAVKRTRAFELFAKGCESWQVSNRLGIDNKLVIYWHTIWRKLQDLSGRKPREVEL